MSPSGAEARILWAGPARLEAAPLPNNAPKRRGLRPDPVKTALGTARLRPGPLKEISEASTRLAGWLSS